MHFGFNFKTNKLANKLVAIIPVMLYKFLNDINISAYTKYYHQGFYYKNQLFCLLYCKLQ